MSYLAFLQPRSLKGSKPKCENESDLRSNSLVFHSSRVSQGFIAIDILGTLGKKSALDRSFRSEDRFRWDREWRLYCLSGNVSQLVKSIGAGFTCIATCIMDVLPFNFLFWVRLANRDQQFKGSNTSDDLWTISRSLDKDAYFPFISLGLGCKTLNSIFGFVVHFFLRVNYSIFDPGPQNQS